MLFNYLKKQKEKKIKIHVIHTMILSLQIPEEQKALYAQAIEIVWDEWMDEIYNNLTQFIEKVEIKEIEDIKKTNFIEISWMRKQEAEEKKKELNAFSFLISNF
jgi:hypothetical protein